MGPAMEDACLASCLSDSMISPWSAVHSFGLEAPTMSMATMCRGCFSKATNPQTTCQRRGSGDPLRTMLAALESESILEPTEWGSLHASATQLPSVRCTQIGTLTDIALWLVHIPREDREYSSFSAKSFETALAETDTCLKLDSLWPCAISTLVSRTPHPALPFWPSLYFPILKGLSRDWSFCARFWTRFVGESRVETYWTWRTLGLFWLILHGKTCSSSCSLHTIL